MQGLLSATGKLLVAASKYGVLRSRTIVTTTGSSTYTAPSNATLLVFQLIGGGGGGKTSAASSSGQIAIGGGGSSGSYSEAWVSTAVSGFIYALVINAGGAANGSAAASTVTSNATGVIVCEAQGGNVGQALATGTAVSFVAGLTTVNGTQIGDVIGDLNQAWNGVRLSATVGINGQGAAGPYACGGGPVQRITQGTGASGGKYGAGGSGGLSINAGGAGTGGAGGQGALIVWEFV